MSILSENKGFYKLVGIMVLLLVMVPVVELPVKAYNPSTGHSVNPSPTQKRDKRRYDRETGNRSPNARGRRSSMRKRSPNRRSRNSRRSIVATRKAKKKSLWGKIKSGISKITKKIAETVKNPVKSIGKAVGDIADGARRGIKSAKNIVTGNGNLADLGNVGMVAFGGVGGSYLIGDASGGNPVLDRGNSNIGNKSNDTGFNSVKRDKTKRSRGSSGGGNLPFAKKKNTVANGYNPAKTPGYNNTTINLNKSGIIPGAYVRPKITKVKVKTGLASSSLDAEVLAKNDKVAETNKAMKKFKSEYNAFETNMKRVEKQKSEIRKLVKELKKYDPKKAKELEKKLTKKQIVDADFNKFGKDNGFITEEKFTISHDKKVKDTRYDSYEDYLSVVENVKKENQDKLKEYNRKAEYNKKIIEENNENKQTQSSYQGKLNKILSKQEETIDKIDNEINSQIKYEKEMDRAVINNSQQQYDAAKNKFEISKEKASSLQEEVDSQQKEIDKLIEEAKKSYK